MTTRIKFGPVYGDREAAKLVLSYGMPRLKPTPTPVCMPDTTVGVVQSMAEGEIGADTAREGIAAMVETGKCNVLEQSAEAKRRNAERPKSALEDFGL